ncbi:MAG: hypothetical protein AAF614_10350 [Chloroflexota bacterium]
MADKETLADRIRPSNAGEQGCYTFIVAIGFIVVRIVMDSRGTIGLTVALGALFMFYTLSEWIDGRSSYWQTALESLLVVSLTAVFAGAMWLFDNSFAQNDRGFLSVTGSLVLLGIFWLTKNWLIRLTRQQQWWPVEGKEAK